MLIDAARVPGDVEAGDAQRAPAAGDGHDVVQDGRRSLVRAGAVAARLEADSIDGRVDLGLAEDLLDLIAARSSPELSRPSRSRSSSPGAAVRRSCRRR